MSNEKNPEVMRALWAQKPFFRRAVAFSVAIGALMLAPSFYMLEVYDRVVNSQSLMTLSMLTLLLALAFFVLEFLQWARMGTLRRAAEEFDRSLNTRVYEAVFYANLSGARALGMRGLRDFASVRDFVCSIAATALLDIPMALALVGVIFWIDTTLGWFSLVSACLQAGIASLNKRASGPPLAKANNASSQAQNFIQAALRNGEAVQAMGMASGLRQHWLTLQEEMLMNQAQASDQGSVYSTLSKYVQLISSSLMLGIGSWLIISGSFAGSSGLMLMASIIAGRALAPLVQVITGWRNVANTQEALERLEALLAKIPARPPGLPLPPPTGLLQVEQVAATAPGAAVTLLHNISFAIPSGKTLAVVGPSASGKTSLAHLLVGVWPCATGKVRLDGVDVFTWNKQELGPYLGYLPQDVALFEGSIAENIARFGPPDPEKVEQAARRAGLHDYLLSLPQGYETEVGAEGVVLSGGTRQRVGLARALYGNPRFVVLDEPNASLDDAGEAALLRTLTDLRAAGVTVVLITHRTSLLGLADLMLVLIEGEAKLFGPRNEVLAALQGQAAPARPAAPPAAPVALRA
ncbi:MAG: type I secretion system permease/ATPase [Candidatus Accumulibacter sp.]|jgi:ATP-binding cassette subfamily C exporter for protease/lipase|nr:type I secretion system permease/ATPase [Accumulibacter sp.]